MACDTEKSCLIANRISSVAQSFLAPTGALVRKMRHLPLATKISKSVPAFSRTGKLAPFMPYRTRGSPSHPRGGLYRIRYCGGIGRYATIAKV